jgi:hypothetical protein
VKKLNENFLDVLQAKDKIQEDVDEVTITNGIIPSTTITKSFNKDERTSSITTATDSTIRESTITPPTIPLKKTTAPAVDLILPPLKIPPPLPPSQTTSDTLSDVKRRREERRRGIGGSISNVPPAVTSPPTTLPSIDTNHKNNNHNNTKISNGIHGPITDNSIQRYTSPKHIEIHDHHMIDADREKRICCTIL